mmetsp:Transcript_5625/g.20143  ORF Transcript_5625/g.20143 Transcript_5625/m.20143 type:complete len:287 (-) Transcript_5625:436-1296(-)
MTARTSGCFITSRRSPMPSCRMPGMMNVMNSFSSAAKGGSCPGRGGALGSRPYFHRASRSSASRYSMRVIVDESSALESSAPSAAASRKISCSFAASRAKFTMPKGMPMANWHHSLTSISSVRLPPPPPEKCLNMSLMSRKCSRNSSLIRAASPTASAPCNSSCSRSAGHSRSRVAVAAVVSSMSMKNVDTSLRWRWISTAASRCCSALRASFSFFSSSSRRFTSLLRDDREWPNAASSHSVVASPPSLRFRGLGAWPPTRSTLGSSSGSGGSSGAVASRAAGSSL